jgi:hypothetical protein
MSKTLVILAIAILLAQGAFSKSIIDRFLDGVFKMVDGSPIKSTTCTVEQPHITLNNHFASTATSKAGWVVSVVSKTDCKDSEVKLVLDDGTSIAPSFSNTYSNTGLSYQGKAFFFGVPGSTLAKSWSVVTTRGQNTATIGPFLLPTTSPRRAFKPSKWAIIADMDASTYSQSTFKRLESIAGQGYDGVIHTGDFAYNVESKNGKKGDDYFNAFSKISTKMPYIVTPGNHEVYDNFKLFNYRFQMPGATNGIQTKRAANYYSFIANGVYFVTINWDYVFEPGSDRSKEVFSWLSADLAKNAANAEIQYRVFFSHKPFYCTFNEVDCLQYYLFKPVESLLYKYKFDLILNSHVHLYYRHKKTDKNFKIVNDQSPGPLFFISGHQGVDPNSGGNKQKIPNRRQGVLEAASAAGEPNYLSVEFASAGIYVTLRDCQSNAVIDSVNLQRGQLRKK